MSKSRKSKTSTRHRPGNAGSGLQGTDGKIIRAVIIDPFMREVREAWIDNELIEFQRICGGGYIEFGIWINRKEPLYVNEWASWSEGFIIGGIRAYSGCGLITGADKASGGASSAKVSVEEIRNVVVFAPVGMR